MTGSLVSGMIGSSIPTWSQAGKQPRRTQMVSFKAGGSESQPPQIKRGIYDARFIGVQEKDFPQSKFDSEAFVWGFELLDDDGRVLNIDGEPVEVEKVTSRSMNVKSKTQPGGVKVLKALLTADEFDAFCAETLELKDEELVGRFVELDISIKENGWPQIDEVRRSRRKAAAGKGR